MSRSESDESLETENVRVFIRVRPLSPKEEADGSKNIVLIDEQKGLIALNKDTNVPNPFKFDQVFSENSTQQKLHESVAIPIVDKSLQGYNGTIFAYGQTGTGKTYTMTGNINDLDTRGIILNTFSHIFDHISKSNEKQSFVVIATYLQIYNEEINDLLSKNPNQKLIIKETPDGGIYVKDLTRFTVDSVESISKLFFNGNRLRAVNSTALNETSSRSHTIFTISIESRLDNTTRIGKLNLVDLAGCESTKKSLVTGQRMKEANNINLSLSALGNVITALVDERSTHIPYRNSKLTRLLQNSLGGNSKTAMIAMISPSNTDYEESMRTLRYAARVKYIKNHAKINVEPRGIIEAFESEIAELQAKIASLHLEKVTPHPTPSRESIRGTKSEELLKYEEEIQKVEMEKEKLLKNIADIQKNILVGGENLIEKAEYQAYLLQSSYNEIDKFDKMHLEMEETLNKIGQERIDIEEKYSNLQEEDEGLTEKIRKVQENLNELKKQYNDNSLVYQTELSNLQEQHNAIIKKLKMMSSIVHKYVPDKYFDTIMENTKWNKRTQEFQLKYIAYTGNNNQDLREEPYDPVKFKFKAAYRSYPGKHK